MNPNVTENTRKATNFSRDEAMRLKNGGIGVEHLFLGLMSVPEASAIGMLTGLGVDCNQLRDRIEHQVSAASADIRYASDSEIPMLRQTEKVLRLSYLESIKMKAKEIHTYHLVLAILQEGDNLVSNLLQKAGVDYDRMAKAVRGLTQGDEEATPLPDFASQTSEDDNDDPFADPDLERTAAKTESRKKSGTPALESFGRDLTKLAEQQKLDPIVGRKKESIFRELDAEAFARLRNVFNTPDLVEESEDVAFSLPKGTITIQKFRGGTLDDVQMESMMEDSAAMKDFWKEQKVEKLSENSAHPLLPFSVGQLGLVLTSGCLDGVIEETGNCSHVVKGRVVKRVDTDREFNEDGTRVQISSTTSNRVEISMFLPDGTFKCLA